VVDTFLLAAWIVLGRAEEIVEFLLGRVFVFPFGPGIVAAVVVIADRLA
jgi:hypothetical protein